MSSTSPATTPPSTSTSPATTPPSTSTSPATTSLGPQIGALGPGDAEAMLDLDRWAFPHSDQSSAAENPWLTDTFEWDRTFGGYLPDLDGREELAGINSTYTMRLPVPGGSVRCAGLTWVGVHPGHRRRGVLTAMMAAHLRAVRERDEPVSVLHATEATIYGRFGYGSATRHLQASLPRRAALREIPGADQVRIRVERVDLDRHADLVGDCYEVARQNRPGMVSRDSAGLRRLRVADPVAYRGGGEPLRIFIAEAEDGGPARGYALFRRTVPWVDGRPAGTVAVREFVARDPAATRALWARLLDLDLTAQVEIDNRPTDDPLFHLLVDRRIARTTHSDGLWVRLVDLPTALAARRYLADLDIVLAVRDELCPWNDGRWRLRGGIDGARCEPSTAEPAFTLDVRELGSAYLGSVPLTVLAEAGLVTVADPDGFTTAARAFGWPVAAYCGWVF